MELYSYFRSSAAFRVRIALSVKGLPYDLRPVHLARNEHLADAYGRVSAARLVPQFVDGATSLSQSLAIIEYLEETHPEPPLLPKTPLERARVRSIAQAIASDIHPLNNLRVLRYLVGPLKVSDEAKNEWYRHWVVEGLTALERSLTPAAGSGTFCHGDTPTLADVCLVPQVYNAERADIDLSPFPRITAIVAACRELPAFRDADPAKQQDAE